MCELSTILTAFEIDGRPFDCDHAVLIRGDESKAAGEWVISLLGIGARDLIGLTSSRRFSATGPQGERYSGHAQITGAPTHYHARLVGQGVLHELREAS